MASASSSPPLMWPALAGFAASAAAQAWALTGHDVAPVASYILQGGAFAMAIAALLAGSRLSPDGGQGGTVSGFLAHCPPPILVVLGFLLLYGATSWLAVPANAGAAEQLRGVSGYCMALYFYAFATYFAVRRMIADDDDDDG